MDISTVQQHTTEAECRPSQDNAEGKETEGWDERRHKVERAARILAVGAFRAAGVLAPTEGHGKG